MSKDSEEDLNELDEKMLETNEEEITDTDLSSECDDEISRIRKGLRTLRLSFRSEDIKCFEADDENEAPKKKREYLRNLEDRHCDICEESSRARDYWGDSWDVILQDKQKSLPCTVRPAREDDLEAIERLCGEDSKRMFGLPNLHHLIESSFLQRILVEKRTGEVVAFISVLDYPNPTFLAETDWEQWMFTKYKTKEMTSQNSIFLHFLVWNKLYETTEFMKILIKSAFSVDPYIEYILFVLPPNTSLRWPYDSVFCSYGERLDEVKPIRSDEGIAHDLLVAFRCDCGPSVELLSASKELDRETCNLLINALGKKSSRKKWFKRIFDKNDKKTIITGLCTDNNNNSDVGIIITKNNVDLTELEKHYDTFPFYKFRSFTKYDTWYQILSGKPALQYLREKCYSEAGKLLIDPNSQKKKESPKVKKLIGLTKKEIAKCKGPYGFNFEYSYTDRREGDCSDSDEGNPRKNLHKEDSSVELPEVYKVVGMNVILKPAKYEFTSNGPGQNFTENEEDGQIPSLQNEPADKAYQRVCSDRILTKPLNLEFFGECLAVELELYDPPANQEKSLIIQYLKAVFEKINRTYILYKENKKNEMNPLLQYFHMVPKLNKQYVPKKSLYICHKQAICGIAGAVILCFTLSTLAALPSLSIMCHLTIEAFSGRTFYTKEMSFGDFEKIMAASWNIPYRKFIQEDLLSIFLKKKLTKWLKHPSKSFKKFLTLEYRSFIFMASDYPVGFAIARPHHDIEYYKANYQLEYYMNSMCHSIDGHGELRHFFLNPLFSQHTRHFLRGVMKICRWTSLIANSSPCRLTQLEGCSVVKDLIHWVQVEPRTCPSLNKSVDRRRYSRSLNKAPRALHLLTYSMSVCRKHIFTMDLVIVGSGDVAYSFLEELLLSRFNANYGFKNLTLIANDGMESLFPEKYSKAVNIMKPWNGRHDQYRRDQCNLESWLQIVKKEMVSIDREKRTVEVEGGDSYHFDYLFLFCGTQFTLPQKRKEKIKPKSIQYYECTSNLFTAQKDKLFKIVDIPKNVFTINNGYEAYKALEKVDTVLNKIKTIEGGQYVVYGNCVEAFSCVAGLLDMGTPGKKITVFITQEGRAKSVSYIHSEQVMDAICKTLKDSEVNIYTDSVFLKWDEFSFEGDTYVEHALFKTDSSTIFCRVLAVFSYDIKTVRASTYQACKKSGLWYTDKLLIDSKFRTSDEKIYAGGSLTVYPAIYKTEGFNHEYYNSVEIGTEIAKRFWDKVLSSGVKEELDEKELLARPVALTRPIVTCAEFADKWYYVRITEPGNSIVAFKGTSLRYKLIQTGNPYDNNGPGLFEMILNEHNIVKDIVCYRRSPIPVKDLLHIYGKHESYLNNLLCRIQGGLITDLFDFFNEPWTSYIFDDKFDFFYQKLHLNYFKQRHLFSNEASFYDFVAYLLNLEKWKGLTRDDENFLEDLFCFNPDLKLNIRKSLINFVVGNEDFLISRLDTEDIYKYIAKFSTSRLLNDFRKEMGLSSVFPEPVNHIIPTTELFRHMDMIPYFNKVDTKSALKLKELKGKQSKLKRKSQKKKDYSEELFQELVHKTESCTITSGIQEDTNVNFNGNLLEDEDYCNFNEELSVCGELNVLNEFDVWDEHRKLEQKEEEECHVTLFPETSEPEDTLNINLEGMKFDKGMIKKLEDFQRNINHCFPEEQNEDICCQGK